MTKVTLETGALHHGSQGSGWPASSSSQPPGTRAQHAHVHRHSETHALRDTQRHRLRYTRMPLPSPVSAALPTPNLGWLSPFSGRRAAEGPRVSLWAMKGQRSASRADVPPQLCLYDSGLPDGFPETQRRKRDGQ